MRYLLYLILLVPIFQLSAKTLIRYNQLGYLKGQPLKFVIISDETLQGATWSILKKESAVESNTIEDIHVGKTAFTSKKYNYIVLPSSKLESGTYKFSVGSSQVTFAILEGIPKVQVENIIRYLKAKRSGKNANYLHQPSHLGDTSCLVYTKRNSNQYWAKTKKRVNMEGGWYDAGDYIKFTLTNAYTTYILAKAYETNPDLFSGSDLKEEIKFGLKYLAQTLPSDYTFIIQTGGYLDHTQGLRLPENDKLDGKREAYSSLSATQMGYTCAALSLGARIADKLDLEDQKKIAYQKLAEKIYGLAKENITSTAWWQGNERELTQQEVPNVGGTGWETFYADESPYDNMSLAALELYQLTNSKSYKKDALNFGIEAGPGWWASWGNCNMYANNELSKISETTTDALREDLNNFYGIYKQKGNIFGRPHDVTWGTLNSVLIVGSNTAIYDLNNKKSSYKKLYQDVYNYVYGLNNWGISFVSDTSLAHSFKSSYVPIFRLSKKLGNIGEVSPGPGDKISHDNLGFNYGKRWEDEFNNSKTVYFDESTDYMTAETTITLVADMIYFLAVYDKTNHQ